MFLILVKFQTGVVFVIEAGLETSVDAVRVLTKSEIYEDCQIVRNMEDS